MNKWEMQSMVRKLSRRRHWHLKKLVKLLEWPILERKAQGEHRTAIAALSKEIDELLVRLAS